MPGKPDTSKPVEIRKNVYWVGAASQDSALHCNPYLLIDGDEAVLFDPGSMLHIAGVLKKVFSLVDLEQIKHVVVHHQDPDLCASLPLLEQMGGKFKIVTHAKAAVLIKHYNVKSEFYYVSRSLNDRKLTLDSGKVLQFYPAWFCHFPGAFLSYDAATKILFTGDMFGGLSDDWNLYADESYIHGMNAFHENYIPSTRIMNIVLKQLDDMDIDVIASQHGAIIDGNVRFYIDALKNLKCGVDFLITPKDRKEQKEELEASDLKESGEYGKLIQEALTRLTNVMGPEKVMAVVKKTTLQVGAEGILDGDQHSFLELERLMKTFVEEYGPITLMYCRMKVQELASELNLKLPEILQ